MTTVPADLSAPSHRTGAYISLDVADSWVGMMRMASAVLETSVEEQQLPSFDQTWLGQLAADLDGVASAIEGCSLSASALHETRPPDGRY